MKAEDYLKSKRLKNPPLDSGISGGGDAPRIRVSDMMKAYAKDQIQKDRQEIKRLMNEKLKDFEGINPDIEDIIDNTPIILE